jgi:CTP-dependent riboflavin kinase
MSAHWVTVPGIMQRGHRVATGLAADTPYPAGTLNLQKPLFKERGLDLSPYYEGTLNISIHPRTFVMRQPQFTFRQVTWTALHPPEDFSFSRCRVIINLVGYAGWVYYPHPGTKQAHFQSPSVVEVIAPFIAHLTYGD